MKEVSSALNLYLPICSEILMCRYSVVVYIYIQCPHRLDRIVRTRVTFVVSLSIFYSLKFTLVYTTNTFTNFIQQKIYKPLLQYGIAFCVILLCLTNGHCILLLFILKFSSTLRYHQVTFDHLLSICITFTFPSIIK